MLARVTTFQVQEGKLDDARAIMRDQILPELRRQPGFAGAVVLSHDEESRGMFIAYWETQADLDLADAKGFWQTQVARTIFLIATVPTRDVYDVFLSE